MYDKIGEAHIYFFPDTKEELKIKEQHKISDYMHCYGRNIDWDEYNERLKTMMGHELKTQYMLPVLYDASPKRDPRIPKNVPSWVVLITEIGTIEGTNIKQEHTQYQDQRINPVYAYSNLEEYGLADDKEDWVNKKEARYKKGV